MEPFTAGDLTIEVEETPSLYRLVWRGKSTARNPAQILQPFFGRALSAAADAGRSLQLEFERLEHFNSSTVSSLIQLVQQCRARNVKLAITFDGRIKWQQLSFDALRVLQKPDGLFLVRSTA